MKASLSLLLLAACLWVTAPSAGAVEVDGAPAMLRYGPDDLRRGELRLPPGAGPFPVAVVIHGGCWLAKVDSLKGMSPLAEALTRRGIATWNIEYRRLGDAGGGWPGTFEDVAAAVDHLKLLAASKPLDLKRLALVGHSSGAQLALWAASRPQLPPPLGGAGALRPAAVVAIDGPGDLAPFIGVDSQVCGEPVIVPLLGGTPAEQPERYRVASPRERLPLGLPQLFVTAGLSKLMQGYIEAARASGDPVEVLAPAGADHFDVITPAKPNGQQVLDFISGRAFAAPR